MRVQSWLNMLAYLVNLGITYGSLTGAFGATNEELSEKYQSLVTPAGYAFAIWGAIYSLGKASLLWHRCFPLSAPAQWLTPSHLGGYMPAAARLHGRFSLLRT